MGDSYQIKDQSGLYFLTCQVVGWVDVFSRRAYRDVIIESLKYCMEHKGLQVFSYVIMTNHVHLIVQSKTSSLSDTIRDFKRFTLSGLSVSLRPNVDQLIVVRRR